MLKDAEAIIEKRLQVSESEAEQTGVAAHTFIASIQLTNYS